MSLIDNFPRLKTLTRNVQERLKTKKLIGFVPPPPPPKTPYKGEVPPPPPSVQTQTKTNRTQTSKLSVEGW